MNEYPRLGFFDLDTDKFCAMIEEMKEKGIVDMANYEDDEWIDVDSGVSEECYAEDDYYDDYMDGDFDSAMSSAGFGTDEDYGMYDDYDDFFGGEY